MKAVPLLLRSMLWVLATAGTCFVASQPPPRLAAFEPLELRATVVRPHTECYNMVYHWGTSCDAEHQALYWAGIAFGALTPIPDLEVEQAVGEAFPDGLPSGCCAAAAEWFEAEADGRCSCDQAAYRYLTIAFPYMDIHGYSAVHRAYQLACSNSDLPFEPCPGR